MNAAPGDVAAMGGKREASDMTSTTRFCSDEEIISASKRVLAENDLHDWQIKIDERLHLGHEGFCNPSRKTIHLRRFVFSNRGADKSWVMDVIFHEVAHALTPTQRPPHSAQVIERIGKDGNLRYRWKIRPETLWQRAQHNIVWARNAIKLGCKPEFAFNCRERAVLHRALRERASMSPTKPCAEKSRQNLL